MEPRTLFPGLGDAVARRTILRPSDNPTESWSDVARRVADGNASLHPTGAADRARLEEFTAAAALLWSGRHLQHGDGRQASRPMTIYTNCSTAPTSFLLKLLLLSGSGVGRSYDDDLMLVDWSKLPKLRLVLSADHPDYGSACAMLDSSVAHESKVADTRTIVVGDSREGWAKLVEILETAAFEGTHADESWAVDFSQVREKGKPIGGMQERPASGPVPLMQAISNVAVALSSDPAMARWEQTMRVDHELAAVVAVGGARRAARMATKWWGDPDIFKFIDIKQTGGLWSANNSVAVDADFWSQAAKMHTRAYQVFNRVIEAQYQHGSGEPGFVNVGVLDRDHDSDTASFLSSYVDAEYIDAAVYSIDSPTRDLMTQIKNAAIDKQYRYIVNPCAEVKLSVMGGFCVHPDTRLLHRTGYDRISELVGRSVDVWNGVRWSTVEPRQTRAWSDFVRVALSDGSYLDCTPDHVFSVRHRRQSPTYYRVNAANLRPGQIVEEFEVTDPVAGTVVENAYTLGFFVGDGSVSYSEERGTYRDSLSLFGIKIDLPLDVRGGVVTRRTEYAVDQKKTFVNAGIETLVELKESTLPEWVFQMSRDSTLQFLAGWLDADGVKSDSLGWVRGDTGKEDVARAMQLLSRRAGLKGVSVHQWASAGDETNYGVRSTDMWGVHFPRSAVNALPLNRVVPDCTKPPRNGPRQQRVVSVTSLTEQGPAYCFTETDRQMGVFNNVLTYQCVIGDLAPVNTDTLDQVRESARLMTRALIRVNTMPSPYRLEVERTNRIGVGITGIHEFAAKYFDLDFSQLVGDYAALTKLGVATELMNARVMSEISALDERLHGLVSWPFWRFLTELRLIVSDEADRYSAELGINAPQTRTTQKPAGTNSKLFGLTEGAHLPAMTYYLRWVQFMASDPLVDDYERKGYPVRRVIEKADGTIAYPGMSIVGFPTKLPFSDMLPEGRIFNATDASPEDQFRWLELLEHTWIGYNGNQISFSLKYNTSEYTMQEYGDLMLTWLPRVRCCSVMPADDWRKTAALYGYVPEQPISATTYSELTAQIQATQEIIDMVTLQCASGACPI